MKKSYNELKISVWNFDGDVTVNFVHVSGEYTEGDSFVEDDFE